MARGVMSERPESIPTSKSKLGEQSLNLNGVYAGEV
jgi:hypothetical protein